ncbi:hypothetical protein CEXT_411591, partial [Caerostris extrusa]
VNAHWLDVVRESGWLILRGVRLNPLYKGTQEKPLSPRNA